MASVLGIYTNSNSRGDFLEQLTEMITTKRLPSIEISTLDELPEYSDHQVIELNENKPGFSQAELSLSKGAWANYADLDYLNRVGTAEAMLGKELFPTADRERLYINPTGWHQLKLKDGQMLYNRSHLIAHQFTGEDNNPKNLMTGTHSLNSSNMRTYEEKIASYLKETGHHVRYRVTPYFKETELLARGVQLEAKSIEDQEIAFNIFIYNVEPDVQINYQTGRAFLKNN